MRTESDISFLILAHTDPRNLVRLTDTLRPYGKVFVHLDKKVDHRPFMLAGSAEFVLDRVDVYWAGYSMIEATLRLGRYALDRDPSLKRLVLLSGVDYPCRPLEDLQDLFRANPDRQFIRAFPMLASSHHTRHLKKWHFQDPIFRGDRFLRAVLKRVLLPRRYALPLRPMFGSQWWALTSECFQWVEKYARENPEVTDFYRRTFAPDEHFFHTLVHASPFAGAADPLEEYVNQGTASMANLHLIDGSLTRTYVEADFEEVVSSGQYFVRKVTSGDSGPLLDRLDQVVMSRASVPKIL